MPQPPNLQKMLAEAQAMLAAQQEAQEALKEREGRRQRRRRHGQGRHDRRPAPREPRIDPDAVDPEDVEMLQDMVVAAVNEAIRKAEELQQSQLGGAEQGGFDPMSALESLGLGGMGGWAAAAAAPGRQAGGGAPNRAARRAQKQSSACSPPPLQRLVTELVEAARGSATAPPSGSPSTCCARQRGRARARPGDPRRQGEDHAVRDLLQPRRGPALHDLPRRAPRHRA